MNDAVAASALYAITNRVTRVYPAQIREALATMSEEQLWWRPNETSNSAGNLVLHLTGSLNHYLNMLVGGLAFRRDREAEFAERRQLPKAEVLAGFEEMIANAERTLGSLTPEQLSSPAKDTRYSILFEDLFAIVVHLSTHTGQLVWIAKMMHDGALDEVWMKSHQNSGAFTAGT